MANVQTIPNAWPLVKQVECNNHAILKASLMRRLAQTQNYLWSNLRRVYANHGCEGNPVFMCNLGSGGGTGTLRGGAQGGLTIMPDGAGARAICSFLVPPNWCGGSIVAIYGRCVIVRTTVATVGAIYACVVDIATEQIVNANYASVPITAAGINDWFTLLQVPQDKTYQIIIYQQFTNGAPTDDTLFNQSMQCQCVSARYSTASTTDLSGDIAPTLYKTHYTPGVGYNADSSAFLRRILDNSQQMFSTRAPELCQSWLAANWNNTNVFVEVGHYTVFTPHPVDTAAGQLYVRCQGAGGAGNEVRVLLNGGVVQTNVALAAGDTVIALAAFAITTNQVNVITVEAKSSVAGANYGTMVLGVSVWETNANVGAAAVPAAYKPLNELDLQGDSPIVNDQDGNGYTTGVKQLFENDRWLAKNRLRHLIGDWRHRTQKRLWADYTSANFFDPRVDWTQGDQVSGQPFAYKNMTINSELYSSAGGPNTATDAIGNFSNGQGTSTGTPPNAIGTVPGSIIYPPTQTFTRNGNRLGLYWFAIPAGCTTHISNGQSSFVVRTRAHRLLPQTPSLDAGSAGPLSLEALYKGTGWFEIGHNLGTVAISGTNKVIPIVGQAGDDTMRQWQAEIVTMHASTGLNPIPLAMAGVLAFPPQAFGAPNLFEIEMCSIFIADAPLSQNALDLLA